MKKLKKGFALLAVSMFMMSMAPNSTEMMKKSCIAIAIDLHNDLQDAGMSHADAYALSGLVLDACEASQP
jgi:hypothetical protein